jgi:hypothetical protein
MSFNANVTNKPALLNTTVTNAGAGAATSTPSSPLHSTPTLQPSTNLEHPFEVLRGAVQHGLDLLGGAIQRGIIIVGGHPSGDAVQQVRDRLDGAGKDLQSQDKLGNTQIQTLMSNYNEAETTMSSLIKSFHDAKNSNIGKI